MIEHFIDELHLQYAFLVAKSNSIRGFVRPSVGPSVRRSVAVSSEHATYGDRPCFYTSDAWHLAKQREKSLEQLVDVGPFTGRQTTVELRNETAVEGKIVHVDGFMNTEMSRVTVRNRFGAEQQFTRFHIHGKRIRFVHIPSK